MVLGGCRSFLLLVTTLFQDITRQTSHIFAGEKNQTTTQGTPRPTLLEKVCGFFSFPPVYSPYPRRLESATIC